ncbi:MAG: ankyrin repeat domain-containing protein [Akkermansia sp.]
MKLQRFLLTVVLPLGLVGCQTSLQKAAENGQTRRVEQIIARGADVNSLDAEGRTALDRAAANDRVEIVQSLLNHGANPNQANRDGMAPLHLAAREGRSASASALLARGAEVNGLDSDGRTPLMYAAYNGFTGVARVLLSQGAGVNLKSKNGYSALTLAADKNQEAMVQLLIQSGADVNSTDNKGKTAAFYTESDNVLIMLKNAGAKIQETVPSSLAGKTITFDFASAECILSDDGGITWQVDRGNRPVSYRMTATRNTRGGGTSTVGTGDQIAYRQDSDGYRATTSYSYRKTGRDTATLIFPGYEWENVYNLRFDTPTSGTATCEGAEESMEWKQSGIRFRIR